jgi:hypothetical protein
VLTWLSFEIGNASSIRRHIREHDRCEETERITDENGESRR